MSTEQNKALVRRFFESLGGNDQATLNELLWADLVAHMPGMPGPLSRELVLQGLAHPVRLSVTNITR